MTQAAFAALAGMFAKNASDKLAEVFDAVMSRKNPVDRKDPLHDGAGGDLKTEPGRLTTGKPIMLAVLGKGFKKDLEVKINGVKRNTNSVADNRIEIAITATDVAKAGPLELSVKNPNESELKKTIDIADPPVITASDPASLTKGTTPPQFTVKGSRFEPSCTATVNGAPRTVAPGGTDTAIKLVLTDADVKEVGKLKLVVINPGGVSSEPFEVNVA